MPDAASLAPQAASIATAAGNGSKTIVVVADNMTSADAAIEAAELSGTQVVYVWAQTDANAAVIGESSCR